MSRTRRQVGILVKRKRARKMNKFWNWAKNSDTGERVLTLEGIIAEESWFGDEITPKEFRAELNSGEGNVVVWINSEGGDVFAATQMYDMLKEYRGGKVTTTIINAFSAASVIAMAGDEVQISPVGMMMIHNPWSYAEGDADEMKTAAKMLDEVKESIINAYELKTKLPRTKLAKMMDDETWIHAHKAVELGFADSIIGAENQTTENFSARNISSRRQVMNCIAKNFKARREPETQKAAPSNRVKRQPPKPLS